MKYAEFQSSNVVGSVLNVGCGGNPAQIGGVHIDLDIWKYENFIQADAHNLPFKDNSFDTVCLGDIVEHLVHPLKALLEAKRVGRRLIITIFEEWRLGKGQHIGKGKKLYQINDSKRLIGDMVKEFPNSIIPHTAHINQFTDKSVTNLISRLQMNILKFNKIESAVHEGHKCYNWLICLEK